jgi:hypothetical protein
MALETYVSGLADLIIDYASARLDDEPFSTSPTEGALQWLLRWPSGPEASNERHVATTAFAAAPPSGDAAATAQRLPLATWRTARRPAAPMHNR